MSGEHIGTSFVFLGTCICMVVSQHVCLIGRVYSNDVGSLRWVLPYQDPCVCTAIRLGGHLTYKPASGHYLKGLFLSENSEEIHTVFNCFGREKDKDFTASSTYRNGKYVSSPSSARLNFKGGPNCTAGWKPADTDRDAWIEVDLGRSAIVSGVITQGRGEDRSTERQWVTKYIVKYNTSGDDRLYDVKSTDDQFQFDGNSDGNTQVTNVFEYPVTATSVRIVPIEWQSKIALRFELMGCLPDVSTTEPKWLSYEEDD